MCVLEGWLCCKKQEKKDSVHEDELATVITYAGILIVKEIMQRRVEQLQALSSAVLQGHNRSLQYDTPRVEARSSSCPS